MEHYLPLRVSAFLFGDTDIESKVQFIFYEFDFIVLNGNRLFISQVITVSGRL